MPNNVYQALCLGGPMAGQYLAHERPEYTFKARTSPIITQNGMRDATYYFIPLMGLRGFWLFDTETKGRQPFDDILRVLCDSYVQANTQKVQQ